VALVQREEDYVGPPIRRADKISVHAQARLHTGEEKVDLALNDFRMPVPLMPEYRQPEDAVQRTDGPRRDAARRTCGPARTVPDNPLLVDALRGQTRARKLKYLIDDG